MSPKEPLLGMRHRGRVMGRSGGSFLKSDLSISLKKELPRPWIADHAEAAAHEMRFGSATKVELRMN